MVGASVQGLFIQNNLFSGTIPTIVNSWHILNSLHSLGFNSSSCAISLLSLDVSNNRISCTIRDSVFSMSKLQTFIAAKNCFSGIVSCSLCLLTSLSVLDMSGMTSGDGCSRKVSKYGFELLLHSPISFRKLVQLQC